MARMRTLKPQFFLNEGLAEIEPLGRLLFQGLWCIADREGRLDDRPKRIKVELLPYDDVDVDRLLTTLDRDGFIIRYEVDGNRYIQVVNFVKHQQPHYKEVASVIPAPPGHQDSGVVAFGVPNEQRERIMRRDGYACVECGSAERLSIDHIVPRSRGGSGADENLRVLCIACNTRKGNREAAELRSNSIQRQTELESKSHPVMGTDTVTDPGMETEREHAPALTLGALALSPTPRVGNVVPLKPVQPPTPIPKPKSSRAPDLLWDACVLACDGNGPANDAERGKWNKGLKSLRQSGATPEEIALRAERYRRRYGDGIPLNPMALASNWTVLATEVHDHGHHNGHTSSNGNYGVADQRSARAGGRSARWNANTPKPLPDAAYWERYAAQLEREGRLAKPRNRPDGELPKVQ